MFGYIDNSFEAIPITSGYVAYGAVSTFDGDIFQFSPTIPVSTLLLLSYETIYNLQSSVPIAFESLKDCAQKIATAAEQLVYINRAIITSIEQLKDVGPKYIAPLEWTGGSVTSIASLLPFEQLLNTRLPLPFAIDNTIFLSYKTATVIEQLTDVSKLITSATEQLIDINYNYLLSFEQMVSFKRLIVLSQENTLNVASAKSIIALEQISDAICSVILSIEFLHNTGTKYTVPLEWSGSTLMSNTLILALEQINNIKVILPAVYESINNVFIRNLIRLENITSVSFSGKEPSETIGQIINQKSLTWESIANLLSREIASVEQSLSIATKLSQVVESQIGVGGNRILSKESISNLVGSPKFSLESIINLAIKEGIALEQLQTVKSVGLYSTENLGNPGLPYVLPYSWSATIPTVAAGTIPFTVIVMGVLWTVYWLAADTDRDAIGKAQAITPNKTLPKNVSVMSTQQQTGVSVKLIIDSHGNNYSTDIEIATDPLVSITYPVPSYSTQRIYQVHVRQTMVSYYTFKSEIDLLVPIIQSLNPSNTSFPIGVRAHGPVPADVAVAIIQEYPSGRIVNLDF